jgi:hypothetical protein
MASSGGESLRITVAWWELRADAGELHLQHPR